MPSEGQLFLHLFLRHINNFHTDPLSCLFSDTVFSTDLIELFVMIEAVFIEGLTLCPCCTSFESTENESSTLKR